MEFTRVMGVADFSKEVLEEVYLINVKKMAIVTWMLLGETNVKLAD